MLATKHSPAGIARNSKEVRSQGAGGGGMCPRAPCNPLALPDSRLRLQSLSRRTANCAARKFSSSERKCRLLVAGSRCFVTQGGGGMCPRAPCHPLALPDSRLRLKSLSRTTNFAARKFSSSERKCRLLVAGSKCFVTQ
jgi:hypothetical protein